MIAEETSQQPVQSATMARLVRYLDVDVLTAAKARIRHTLDIFDYVAVAFSGGKDSLVTLELVAEVYQDLGRTDKVNFFFRDEELIPDDVINFVRAKAESGRFNVRWIAVPMKSEKFILGRAVGYLQWDPSRAWLRPKPSFAETDLGEGPDKPYSQYEMDQALFRSIPGKVGVFTGIRAQESLTRLRSCLNKRNENYITATETAKVHLIKPLYDWSQKDVFRYFYDRKLKYCEIYDSQIWNRQELRVATPLLADGAKKFSKLRTLYPTYYQQLIDLFPEMLQQEKYWSELDRYAAIHRYPKSWNGILQYIRETIEDPNQRRLARSRVDACRKIRETAEKRDGVSTNFSGYPILYVFKAVIAGSYKRMLTPVNKQPSRMDVDYEHAAARENKA